MILIFGYLAVFVAKKTKIPSLILLILSGVMFSVLEFGGEKLFYFPDTQFIDSLLTFFLIIILFDKARQIKFKEFDSLTNRSFMFFLTFFILNLILLSLALVFILERFFVAYILLVAIILSENTFFIKNNHKTSKGIQKTLNYESTFSAVAVILFSFFILDYRSTQGSALDLTLFFAQKIVIGVGMGLLFGILILNMSKHKKIRKYAKTTTFLIFALISYYLADVMGGNGFFAVAAFGLFLTNSFIKKEEKTQHAFSEIIKDSIYVITFVLIGLVVRPIFDFKTIMIALLIFGLLLLIRFISIIIIFRKRLSLSEEFYLTANQTNGVTTAILIILLLGQSALSSIIIICIILGVLLETIVDSYFSKKGFEELK